VIETSSDGQNFVAIDKLTSAGVSGDALNTYTWSETYRQGKYYYRIKMFGERTGTRYSKVITVDGLVRKANLVSVINPFSNQLTAYLDAPEAGIAKLQLVDNMGTVVRYQNASLQQGINSIIISNTANLPTGIYTLKIVSNQSVISKKLVKQ
jgi:hypothetical protein